MDGNDNTLALCNVPGVPPLLRPARVRLGHPLGLLRHGLRQLSSPPFGPRSSSPSSFGFLVAPELSSPSPFDPASKQTNWLLSLSSSLHRFENPPKLKLPGFSFSCRMTPEHQILINRGIKTCFPLSRLSLHRSQKYPPKVSGLLFPRLW